MTYFRILALPGITTVALIAILLTDSNQTLFLTINAISRLTGDTLWANWTILGDGLVVYTLLLPFVGRRPDIVWASILASLVTIVVIYCTKSSLGIERPPAVVPPELIHIIGPAYRSNSFPSGHTAAAFTFAGAVGLMAGRLIPLLSLALLAAGVGISRIAVGVHWPLDVLGGITVGWLAAVFGVWLAGKWPWGINLLPQRLFASGLFLIALLLLTLHDTHYEAATSFQIAIALFSMACAVPGLIRLYQGRVATWM